MQTRDSPNRATMANSGVWQNAADALVAGLRKTFDYQRAITDDYRERFLDTPRRGVDQTTGDWNEFTAGVAAYATDIFAITVDYYRGLADAAGRYAEASYPDLYGQSPATRYYGPGGRLGERASLEISGQLGDHVVGRFAVENSDDCDAEVFVDVGLCRGPRGESIDLPVSIKPDAMIVASGGSAAVEVDIYLDPCVLTADCYRFPISIHGPDPAVIDVTVRVCDQSESTKPPQATYTEAAETTVAETTVGGTKVAETTVAGSSDQVHQVRCPMCARVFDRTTQSLRLRPHNDDAGAPCDERDGTRVS